MPDLATTYLGLQLKNPLIVSASPLSKKADYAWRLAEAGAAAIVMYSLFEEQITHESHELDHYLTRGSDSYAEALSYFPDLDHYNLEPQQYLEQIRLLKRIVDIPVIGSLNGVSAGGWIEYAQQIQEAGADALELNIYFLPTDPLLDSAAVEDHYVELVAAVRQRVTLPVAVKLSPYITALPHLAQRLVTAGADGLVFFNRFFQPDFDLDELTVVPGITLSTSADLRLPLRWVAILYKRIACDFGLTGGVHTARDVLKAMMAGANATLLASALIKGGPSMIATLLTDLKTWMEEHEYDSINQMRGSMSQQSVLEPAAFERANYLKALNSLDTRLL